MDRDKASLDIFWLRDDLFDPDVLAKEIVEDPKPPSNNSEKSPRI